MGNSSYYERTQWSNDLLESIRNILCSHSSNDTFQLIVSIKDRDVCDSDMCSLAVPSPRLVTTVRLFVSVSHIFDLRDAHTHTHHHTVYFSTMAQKAFTICF